MKKLKILIAGAKSKTAEALQRILSSETDYELYQIASNIDNIPDINKTNISNISVFDIKALKKYCYDLQPDFIINTVGMSDINLCESNHNLCWQVNTSVVENFVAISRVLDCHLIIYSSDNVFDGKKGPYSEDDRPDPINYFGKSKHTAENACLAGLNKYTIIRTSQLYGISNYNKEDFVKDCLLALDKEQIFYTSKHEFTTPTFIDDVALATYRIIQKNRTGIYNVSGTELLDMYSVCKKIASFFGFDESLIQEYTNDMIVQRNKYIKRGGLINLKAETDLNIKFSTLLSSFVVIRYQLLEKSKSNNKLFNFL